MAENKGKIFPHINNKDFLGSGKTYNLFVNPIEIFEHCNSSNLLISGRRKTGKTILLEKIYNVFFEECNEILPIYYKLPKTKECDLVFAKDFFTTSLRQFIGFINKDPSIITANSSIQTLKKLLKATNNLQTLSYVNDFEVSFSKCDINTCLEISFSFIYFLLSSYKIKVMLLIDDSQNINLLNSKTKDPFSNFLQSVSESDISLIISVNSKENIKNTFSGRFYETLRVIKNEDFSQQDCERLIKSFNLNFTDNINNPDLSSVLKTLSFNPFYIKMVLNNSTQPYKNIKDFYFDYYKNLSNGKLNLYFTSILNEIPVNLYRASLQFLNECLHNSLTDINKCYTLNASQDNILDIFNILLVKGFITGTPCNFKLSEDNVLKDFITIFYDKTVKGMESNAIYPEWIWNKLKMIKSERVNVSRKNILNLCMKVLDSFSYQHVPKALLDNNTFNIFCKAIDNKQIDLNDILINCKDFIQLPSVIATELIESLKSESEHILTSYGFLEDYDKDAVFITGSFISSQIVDTDSVVSFLKKAETISRKKRFKKTFKWIIAREGFTLDANNLIKSNNIFSSNLTQILLLKEFITSNNNKKTKNEQSNEYEFELSLPTSTDTELIAAKAVEEIAKKARFDETATAQIKMALIEACINAFEYSTNKDTNIFLKFLLNENRLTIFVENEGWTFNPDYINEPDINSKISGANKRGWGIKIIKNFMDEVKFDRVDNFTRLKMVKYVTGNT